MKCDYLNRSWVAFNWWIALNLMKCDRLNSLIKSTYIARQVENEYTSFVCSRLDSQNTDDEMIKQDHENESSQTIFAWENLYYISQIIFHTIENRSSQKTFARENLYHIFQITSHIETKCKTRYQAYSRSKSFHQYSSQ